jgi:hypothetical protein
MPAGELTLGGAFFADHRQEILNLIHHAESEARAEHPLERIMEIEEREERTVITFTDAHLAHGIGEALRHAVVFLTWIRISIKCLQYIDYKAA